MKKNRWFTAAGLLMFFLLCLIPNGQAQQATPLSQAPGLPYQVGLWWRFTSASGSTGGFTSIAVTYWRVQWIVTGSLSGCSLSLDSINNGTVTTGGVISAATIGSCASTGSYITTSATTPASLAQLTPTITGAGSIIVSVLGYTDNPAAGSTTTGNVNVTNSPAVSQSGTWNVAAQMQTFNGSTWVNAVGWPLDASTFTAGTTPVVPLAAWYSSSPSNCVSGQLCTPQLTIDRKLFVQDFQGTSPWVTQPSGFASLVAAQQAVTASAVALPSNAVHGFCVEALLTNANTVYVGPSGVTTSTGFPLTAGQTVCYQLSNTNLAYVIAAATGSSVAITGN